MTPVDFLRPTFVESFPAAMDPGVLYISISYRTCGHLCCCGCGQEVITPLSPAQWSFTYDGENVSLSPSTGNWALLCQSHYWIRKGKVHWAAATRRSKLPTIGNVTGASSRGTPVKLHLARGPEPAAVSAHGVGESPAHRSSRTADAPALSPAHLRLPPRKCMKRQLIDGIRFRSRSGQHARQIILIRGLADSQQMLLTDAHSKRPSLLMPAPIVGRRGLDLWLCGVRTDQTLPAAALGSGQTGTRSRGDTPQPRVSCLLAEIGYCVTLTGGH